MKQAPAQASHFPLFERFPALAKISRVALCTLPSPVEPLTAIREDLWIKRDDLNAPACGGNKVRALEFLLGGLAEGDTVFTMGGTGSTHVLSTAIHASRLGVTTAALRWNHDMNATAERVSQRIEGSFAGSRGKANPLAAIAITRYRSLVARGRYIAIGGSAPLGILGHVNAALELAEQISRGEMPMPSRVILPLGSGGTTAGLLLGFAIAKLPIEVVGARVGPRAFVNRTKVFSLVRKTARLIRKLSGEEIPSVDRSRLRIVQTVYGGGYGRPLARASRAAKLLHDTTGIVLDETYSAKAWTAALEEPVSRKGPILFWLTFDPSCLTS